MLYRGRPDVALFSLRRDRDERRRVSAALCRYAAMPMLVVVPGVKRAAELSCFDDVGEGRWELRLIFRRFEQRFDVRVVIRYMRT
jgi:hypothetical protein